MRNVIALILAGGGGQGFGVLTRKRAKAALPYAGHYRLIDFALSNLADADVPRVGVIIQYLPGSLLEHVGTGQAWDFDGVQRTLKVMPPFVGVGDTQWYRGTADAVRRNFRVLKPQPDREVLICSGEHAFSIDFQDVIAFHRERQAGLTLIVKRVTPEEDSDRFGRLEFDPATGLVKRFEEKPSQRFSSWISIGMYVFRGAELEAALERPVDGNPPANLAKDIVEPFCRDGRAFAYVFDGRWDFLEDLGRYYESHRRLICGPGSEDLPVWQLRTNLLDRSLGARTPAFFSRESHVESSVIAPGCRIFGRVFNSVLSPGVVVSLGAEVRDSILLHDTVVEEGARIRNVVADKDSMFGAGCRVGWSEPKIGPNPELPALAQRLAVVGKGARVGAGADLPFGMQVYDGGAVPRGSVELSRGDLNLGASAAD